MGKIRIGTWNINSIRARIDHLLGVLRSGEYHTLLLQETKCSNQDFAAIRSTIEDTGYNIAYNGQKSYNGVAILSKSRIEEVNTDLHKDDSQARYAEALIEGLTIVNIYAPNGNPIDSPKFTYKLDWMESLKNRIKDIVSNSDNKLVLAGDFNVAPTDLDCHDPVAYKDDAVTQKESREKFNSLIEMGLTDLLRERNKGKAFYTYWGYRAFAWQRNAGLRLDHILLSNNLLGSIEAAETDPSVRNMPKASDHCIAWTELRID